MYVLLLNTIDSFLFSVIKLRDLFFIFALVFVLALVFQVKTNIVFESQEREIGFSDRIMFYLALAVGLFLAKRDNFKCLRWKVLISAAIFIGYMLILAGFTTNIPLLAYVLPNYGIASWMLLGAASNLAIISIGDKVSTLNKSYAWYLVMWIPAMTLGVLVFGLGEYAKNPERVDSYQFPAVNLIVLFLFGLLALDRWQILLSRMPRKNISTLPFIAFAVLGTYLSYLVSLLNSTAIVAVWALLFLAFLWRFFLKEGWHRSMSFLVPIILFLIAFWDSEMVAIFLTKTRFGQLSENSLFEFSSLSSRSELLPLFFKQFSVSPIFGHMQAEVASGFAPGNFVHSLPFSALTHTGLVGTAILFLTIFFAFNAQKNKYGNSFHITLFSIVFGCATIFAFFTWIPFWFMIGYLAVKPNLQGFLE